MSHYTGWNRPLIVTLTATSNPYLKDKLPLRGELTIQEMRTDGYAMHRSVSFLQIDEDGNPVGGRVMVDHPEFTYTLPHDRTKETTNGT